MEDWLSQFLTSSLAAIADFVANAWQEFCGYSPLGKLLAIATLCGFIGVPAALAWYRWRTPAPSPSPKISPELERYLEKLAADNAQTAEELSAAREVLKALEEEREKATEARAARIAEAQSLAAEGNFEAAESIFEDLASEDVGAGRDNLKRAAAALKHKGALGRLRSIDAALADYARAAELDPDDSGRPGGSMQRSERSSACWRSPIVGSTHTRRSGACLASVIFVFHRADWTRR